MRTRHWLTAVTSGCLMLAGIGRAWAQPPGMQTNGNPDQVGMGMLPAPMNQSYGPVQPGYTGMNNPGYPPGANQWPNVSPFAGPPVNSTAYENGFWWNRTKQGSRQYYFNAEAIFGHAYKPSTALIGAPDVNPLNIDAISGLIISAGSSTGSTTGGTTTGATSTSTGGGSTQYNQTPISGPIRSTSTAGGTTGTGTGATTGTGTTGTGTTGTTGGGTGSTGTVNIFPTQDTGILPDNLFSTGMRGSWGWFNNDDSGFVVSGFAQGQSTSTFQLNDPLLNLNTNDFRNENTLLHLHAWFGLPLGGADTDGTSLRNGANPVEATDGTIRDGAVIGYDMGVIVSFWTRLAGANTDWYFAPIYEQKNVKIRTLAGAKYLRLQEGFLFDGTDSGLGYTISSSASSGGGQTGGTTGGSTGGGTTGSGYLTPTSLQADFSIANIIRSHLTSSTLSDMAGPEVGVRVDLGGKKFQLWTQTKAGAMANVSQREVSGFGIGNAFNIITPNTVPTMSHDPSTTTFSNSQTTTTISPMFEQQINAKIPIFNLVPYLRKMELFERATLTGGYTFLFVGNVYRPQNSIIWNQWPNTPQLNRHTSNYLNSMFNVGVEWTY